MNTYEKLPLEAQKIVEKLGLEKSYEGVYVKSVYETKEYLAQNDKRFAATTAYALIASTAPSLLHRLDCDEIWHFYSGNPVDVFLFFDTGLEKLTFGSDVLNGHKPKIIIPKGTVFGALVKKIDEWCLFGCTCIPGFSRQGCEFIKKDNAFLKNFVQYRNEISKLTQYDN